MTNMNNFSFFTSILVTVVILAMAGYLIPTLKQRLGEDKAAEIKRLITLAVRYAEQVFTPDQYCLQLESQGRGSLVGCRLWGHTESDMTEAT